MNLADFVKEYKLSSLHCNNCGKQVSTLFIAIPTDTPDKGIIIRAWIECPECLEKNSKNDNQIRNNEQKRRIPTSQT